MKGRSNDLLFSHTHAAKTTRRVERRRLLRGELAPRREPDFEWADEGRADDSWDECIGTTVACSGKLVAE